MNTLYRILVCSLLVIVVAACNYASSQAPTWTPAPAVPATEAPATSIASAVASVQPEAGDVVVSWPRIDISNVDRLGVQQRIEAEADSITHLDFSHDGRLLAVGSNKASVEIYDVMDASLVAVLEGHRAPTPAVAFSPDGTTLATGSWDRTIRLWSTADWSLIEEWTAHESYVTVLAFSPDGSLLASGGEDNAVNLWPATGGERLFHLVGSGISVGTLVFSPGGELLVAAYGDSQARVWSVADGTLLRSLVGYSTTRSLAFSDDGSLLAGGSWSYSPETLEPLGRIAFFDPQSGERLYGSESNTGALAMVFSADGSLLFSTTTDDEDFRLRVWRGSDGVWLDDLRQLGGQPYALARSPDGSMLATGAQGGTILIWGVEP